MGARLRRRALAILGVVVAAGAVTVAACKTRPMDGSGSAVVKADQAPAAGTPDFYRPGNRLVSPGADAFVDEIQPILAEKCVSCHACSEAPCQLKLDGMAGILRGATAIDAYASRVKAVEHTGNEHRFDPAGWQKRGFWPVTQGGDNSLLAKAIAAGANHQPGADLGPASADHTWTCPADSAAYA